MTPTELSTAARQHILTEDGYLLNAHTGEVVGLADDAGRQIESPDPFKAQAFELAEGESPLEGLKRSHLPPDAKERQMVEEYLRRRALASAHIDGLTSEMNLLIAGIKERYETQIAEADRKVVYLDKVFGHLAERVAVDHALSTDFKSKTVKLQYGSLSYRSIAGALEVADPIAAAASAIAADLDAAVKVEVKFAGLRKAADDSDEKAIALYDALLDHITDGPENGEKGVKVSIAASELPDELPASIKGMGRAKPGHPLGRFAIEHYPRRGPQTNSQEPSE